MGKVKVGVFGGKGGGCFTGIFLGKMPVFFILPKNG